MNRLWKHLSLVLALFLLQLLPTFAQAARPAKVDSAPEAQPAQPSGPPPLPRTCIGGGTPPACCAYGYVFVNGFPALGAQVLVQSASGSTTVATSYGPAGPAPYYYVNLSAAPLNIQPGDIVTFTAIYQNGLASMSHVAQIGSQQVDLTINYTGWEGQIGGPTYAVAISGTYAYIGNGPRLVVLDIVNPSRPALVGQQSMFIESPTVRDVAIQGNYAYLVHESGLSVFDVSDPTNPIGIGGVGSYGVRGVAVQTTYAYGVGLGGGLYVWDISNPARPFVFGFCETPGNAYDVTVNDNYAYIANGESGLRVIDVSSGPVEVGFYDTPGVAYGVAVKGVYAYVADENALRIVDITNPYSPTETGFVYVSGGAYKVKVQDNYAYVTDGNGDLHIIDISNPGAPNKIGLHDVAGMAYDAALSNGLIYLADSLRGGVHIVDVTNPLSPNEIGFYSTPADSYSVAVEGSYAYLADGYSGLKAIDISNPTAPAQVGFYDTPGIASGVIVSGTYAYIADNYGVYVVDVSDPSHLTGIGVYTTSASINDIAMEGPYLYIVDWNQLQIVDVSNPANPVRAGWAGVWAGGSAIAVVNHYAYIATTVGLKIFNVSNPASPTTVGIMYNETNPRSYRDVAVAGNYAYLAAGEGLYIVDVANPRAPSEIGFCPTSTAALGVAVDGNYAYIANAWMGLSIVNVSDPTNPTWITRYRTLGCNVNSVVLHNNRAYVTDNFAGLWIFRYELTTEPILALHPTAFTFEAVQGGSNPAAQTLNTTNGGAGTLNWTADESLPWLSLSSTSGTAPSTVNVSVDIAGLGAGTYTGTIVITAAGAQGSPRTVPVTLTVSSPANPILQVSPASLTFVAMEGGSNPAAQTLHITNGGVGTLHWTAAESLPWLSLSSTSGTAPSTVDVSVDTAGLAAGTYTGTVVITAEGAQGSPQTVPVTLTVIMASVKPWTFILYLDGDYSDIYPFLERAVQALEALPANTNISLVVLFDGDRNGDGWRFLVQPGGNYTLGVNKWYIGEPNMGDPQTLAQFILWAREHYPAQHYYLSIADHGRGTEGIAYDLTNGDYLTTTELSTALQLATNSGQWKIDVLHYDACLMAMLENAYQVRDYADYLIASQNLGWAVFAYNRYAQLGAQNLNAAYAVAAVAEQVGITTTPRQLALDIADAYFNHPDLATYPRTISVMDLGQAVAVRQAVDNLAAAMRPRLGSIKDHIANARFATQKFDSRDYYKITDDDEYLDLYDLAARLKQYVPDSDVQAAAQEVMDVIADGFVIAEHHQSGVFRQTLWDLDDAHGVSIYFPPRPGSGDYTRYINHQLFQFTFDGQWDEFLADYFGVIGLPPEPPTEPGLPPMLFPQFRVYLPVVVRG